MAFIEFHLLQNFAPSNLNRDDTNAPKSCHFGGSRRARISSQCQKRQIRLHPSFEKMVKKHAGDLGDRTKRLAVEIAEFLESIEIENEKAAKVAENLLKLIDIKLATDKKNQNKKNESTQYLLYLGKKEINALKKIASENVDALSDDKSDKKSIKKEVKEAVSPKSYAADIALFGRMVADNKEMNVDAACQVAHAISTNDLTTNMDFFTAVDDLLKENEQGSGMMGSIYFNSACYYRYAQINTEILSKNLGNDRNQVVGAIIGFYQGLMLSVPSGKQNSFAAQNPPSYVKVAIRDEGSPWALTNAFVKSIQTDSEQRLDYQSVIALEKEEQNLKKMYGQSGFLFEGSCSLLEGIDSTHESIHQLGDAIEAGLSEVL